MTDHNMHQHCDKDITRLGRRVDELEAALAKLVTWEDVDAATYTADAAHVNGHVVMVCLDDEGPLRPAYFWDIDDDRSIAGNNGWASSVQQAKADAIIHVLGMGRS